MGEKGNGNNGNIVPQEKEQEQDISISQHSRVNGFSLAQLDTEDRAREEREFYRIFFFANALNPGRQSKQFVAANERNRWTDRAGNVWFTPEQRRAAAEGYCLDREFATCSNNELWVVERIYKALKQAGHPDADNWILRDSVGCLATPAKQLVLHAPAALADYLQSVAGDKIVAAVGIPPEWKLYFTTTKFPRKK